VQFCKDVLQPFFLENNIIIQTPLIKKSAGGIVSWPSLQKQIEIHLAEPGAYVTTLIDFYGIENRHQFPRWQEFSSTEDKNTRVTLVEAAMKDAIDERKRRRFIA